MDWLLYSFLVFSALCSASISIAYLMDRKGSKLTIGVVSLLWFAIGFASMSVITFVLYILIKLHQLAQTM